MYKQSLGLIGGFGAYATLHFYKRILEEFACTCERDYPHIYMDNDFTMPSRTRSLLTGEDYEEIVEAIAASIKKMEIIGADYIILICGTAHNFLPDVYKRHPELKEKILDIIDELKNALTCNQVDKILIIATEGTLKTGIYPRKLEGIECIVPTCEEYTEIRSYIEAVKQNKLDQGVAKKFLDFLKKYNCQNVVLGCTEFPVLVDYIKENKLLSDEYVFWDPLEVTLDRIKDILI